MIIAALHLFKDRILTLVSWNWSLQLFSSYIIVLKCVATNLHQGVDDKWCADNYKTSLNCLNGGACKLEINNDYESNPEGNISSSIYTCLFYCSLKY